MRTQLIALACVTALLFGVGCSLLIEESDSGKLRVESEKVNLDDFEILTDRPLYEMEDGTVVNGGLVVGVNYKYLNQGNVPYFLGDCFGDASGYVEKLVGSEWKSVSFIACHALVAFDEIIEVRPGTHLDVEHELRTARIEAPGIFRIKKKIFLVWDERKYREAGNRGQDYPFETLYSNEFEIR